MAAPFGAVAFVHAWERIGAGIAHIARVLLMLPLSRYVDDSWSAERCVFTCVSLRRNIGADRRAETTEHALGCFVRLVRVLLGESAIADDKCEYGPSLVILGVQIDMAENCYKLSPAVDKVDWPSFLFARTLFYGRSRSGSCLLRKCWRKGASGRGMPRSLRGNSPGDVPTPSSALGAPCLGCFPLSVCPLLC